MLYEVITDRLQGLRVTQDDAGPGELVEQEVAPLRGVVGRHGEGRDRHQLARLQEIDGLGGQLADQGGSYNFV